MIGRELGPYEITARLGEGGMGEVYRAHDSRLKRDVAIKVLPAAFTQDKERLARFEREAQLLAQLNHPSIAHIYGMETSGESHALVMELVEGPTLADRLARGALPLDEALSVAKQIAEALEEAHEKGIVHRDLKPQNIKASIEGKTKVLDFGLAKAMDMVSGSGTPTDVARSPTLMQSPTLTAAHGTQLGMILGTAAYMAPEQARGGAVDKRADIWAFGVVLYEMLSGEGLFTEGSVIDTLSAVMRKEIDLGRLPPATPPRLRELVRRCLERDPRRRLRDIGDARIELEAVLGGGASADTTTPVASTGTPAARPAASRRVPILLTAAAILAVGLLGLVLGRSSAGSTPSTRPAPTIRATVPLPAGTELDGIGSPVLALSRDGSALAFLAREAKGPQRLYVRSLDSDQAKLVPGSETGEGPFFSPDGRWVAFAVGVSGYGGGIPAELRKYSLATGLTQTVCAIEDFFGGVWREDDTILFFNNPDAGVWAVPASGGEMKKILDQVVEGGIRSHRGLSWPALLPGGRALLASLDARSTGEIGVLDLESGELTSLGIRGSSPRYLPTGHLAFGGAGGSLEVVPFELSSRRVTGSPVAMLANLAFSRWRSPAFAVADDGTLVFTTGYLRLSRREPMRIVRASRQGAFEVMPIEPELFGRALAVSPDGRRLALAREEGGAWIADLARGARSRSAGDEFRSAMDVVWSGQGDRMAWLAAPPDHTAGFRLFTQAGSGSDAPEPLGVAGPDLFLAGWESGGDAILYARLGQERGSTIERFRPGGASEVLITEPGNIGKSALSPDGRSLAYEIDHGEGYQIKLLVVATGERVAVTSAGGRRPSWSGDGRELYYSRAGSIFAVSVRPEGDGAPRIGPETRLFDWPDVFVWTASSDGSFYGTEPVPGAARQTSLELLTGWFAEVERLAGRGGKR